MVQDLSPRPRSVWLTGRRGLQYAISVLLTVLFLWIAFRGTDGPRLLASLREANYWWIGLSFVCLLASHLVRVKSRQNYQRASITIGTHAIVGAGAVVIPS